MQSTLTKEWPCPDGYAYSGTGTPNDPPTCSLNPNQETITSGGTASVTLTVDTTAATSAMRLRSLGGTALVAFAILIFVPRRRWRGLMMLLVLGLVTTMACTACGGNSGGSSSSIGGGQNSGTATGSYKVTVTATSGSDTATATIPLTVQ